MSFAVTPTVPDGAVQWSTPQCKISNCSQARLRHDLLLCIEACSQLVQQEAHQLRDGLEGVELQYERDDDAEELVNVLMRVAYDKEQQVARQEQTPRHQKRQK